MSYLNQEEMDERVERFWAIRLNEIIALVKKYSNLEHQNMLNETHHRIVNLENPKKFIDFWQTGTMRDMNGKYYGMGYKNCNIAREIEKLALRGGE